MDTPIYNETVTPSGEYVLYMCLYYEQTNYTILMHVPWSQDVSEPGNKINVEMISHNMNRIMYVSVFKSTSTTETL